MSAKQEQPEEMVSQRELAAVLLDQEVTVREVVCQIGVTKQMLYRCRKLDLDM